MKSRSKTEGLGCPDNAGSARIRARVESIAVAESLVQFASSVNIDGLPIRRPGGDLKASRREIQGILSGVRPQGCPDDKVTLFLLRTKPQGGECRVVAAD